MVSAHPHSETVFSVLGDAARRRGARSLFAQLILSVVVAAAIIFGAPQWWSLAFLAGWSVAWSAWGLLVRFVEAREPHPRPLDALLVTLAAAGTTLAIVGIVGVAMALFTGNGKSPYNACGKGATDARCQAWANPSRTSGPIK